MTARFSAIALVASTFVHAVAVAGGGGTEAPIIPGEVTVRVTNPAQLDACLAVLSKQFQNVRVLDSIPGRNIHLLGYGLMGRQGTVDMEAALLQLTTNQTILWGELNYGAQTAEGKTDSLWVSQVDVGTATFSGQYAFELMGVPTAHAISTGVGTTIAILDTGIDASHPLLAGRVSPLSLSLVGTLPATVEVSDGIDADGDGNPSEMLGHGTFVAGLIAGVAPDAKLISVRVLDDDGFGDLYKITKAMYWAIDQGVDVINMSLGSTYKGRGSEEAADDAWLAGIVVVAAAGNENLEKPREYPACDGGAIGVASTDHNDLKAAFSNFNDRLSLSAPGTSVALNGVADPNLSIISAVPGGGPNGAYAWWEGTSMSTAFVSGAFALVRAQYPQWPTQGVPVGMMVDTMLSTLGQTSVELYDQNPAYEDLLGAGRIHIGEAVLQGPPQPLFADLDLDGQIGAADIAVLLGAWGTCATCRADLNSDGTVDAMDLSLLLGAW